MSEREVRDVVIIGAGCAGWTAAIYAARANLNPLLFQGDTPGGQLGLTTDVENYPGFPEGILGPELMQRMEQQARRFGTEVRNESVSAVDFNERPFKISTKKGDVYARSAILCTGSTPRRLFIPGEDELWGFGVSACATCDGALYRGKVVAVVGGGDSAAEEATFLTRFAEKVYLIHRREQLRASDIMARRVMENKKIEPVWKHVVTAACGEKQAGGLTHVQIQNVDSKETRDLPVDGFFLAIGHDPTTKLFEGQIELDEQGYIVTDKYQQTNVKGVFAAGDVQDHIWQQAITAAGTGCAAAIAAEKYLEALEGDVYPDERRQEIVERTLEAS